MGKGDVRGLSRIYEPQARCKSSLSLMNAASCISNRSRLERRWRRIKPLALRQVFESIKNYMDKRAHTPTGIVAQELQVKRENEDDVQAQS